MSRSALILRNRAKRGVSKDGAATWFETRSTSAPHHEAEEEPRGHGATRFCPLYARSSYFKATFTRLLQKAVAHFRQYPLRLRHVRLKVHIILIKK